MGPLIGIVRYPDGARVRTAKVWVERRPWAKDGGATFTDYLGRYCISVRGSPGDTVTVVAADGYDGGAYAATSSGSARVILHESVIPIDIVLDQVTPI